MSDEVTEKVYCTDNSNAPMWAALMSQKDDSAATAALMNQNNAWNNNPFVYLVWMMMMRYMNGNGWDGSGENYNSRAISQLQDTVASNHNNDIALAAIQGNTSAIGDLATTLGTNFSTMQLAVSGVKSAIDQVAGQIGFSSEKVINGVLLGNKDLQAQIAECCCANKQLVQQMGYENQIAILNQTNALQSRIDQLANGTQTGFAQVGYATAQQTNELMQNQNANTQRIVDVLNSHWTADLQQKYNDARLELSQSAQNAYLISQLKTTTSTTA